MSLFGTSGIRGDAQTLFTDQFCFDIGRAFINFLEKHNQQGSIAIGVDTRESSPRIAQALSQGLQIEGCEVFNQGICPVPAMNWILKSSEVVGSVMITGSHIAPHMNGMKFYALDEEITKEHESEIEDIYQKLREKKQVSQANYDLKEERQAQELYVEMLKGLIKVQLPRLKVVVDCANGGQTVVIPDLLEQFGLKVIRVNCDTSGKFIARDTDTDDKAVLDEIKEKVRKEDADCGIAYDGDGDRVVFIDERGNFITGEYSCSLIAKQLDSDIFVTTISASQVVDYLGKQVVRTKVGSPYVIAGMKESGSVFGFEPNGGAIFGKRMYTRDGGSMTVEILNLFANWNGTFSEMTGQLPKFYMTRTKVDCPVEINQEIIKEAKEEFKGIKIEEIDGLKIWLDSTTWILFRPSANAPEFRVFAESENEEKASQLLESGMGLVNKIIGI